jgi:hypothetical protein
MPDDIAASGLVSRDDLAALADLLDRFAFALDPLSAEAKEAESRFEDEVRRLFHERVTPRFPAVQCALFRIHLRSLCRAYLKKNPPV